MSATAQLAGVMSCYAIPIIALTIMNVIKASRTAPQIVSDTCGFLGNLNRTVNSYLHRRQPIQEREMADAE